MNEKHHKEPPQRPDSAAAESSRRPTPPQGQPGPMAPHGGEEPDRFGDVVGQTVGHAADDEDYDSGEADLIDTTPDRNTRENERAPKPGSRH